MGFLFILPELTNFILNDDVFIDIMIFCQLLRLMNDNYITMDKIRN
jgi:hypothetical protein